jgi:hypothetical protein
MGDMEPLNSSIQGGGRGKLHKDVSHDGRPCRVRPATGGEISKDIATGFHVGLGWSTVPSGSGSSERSASSP